jgi:hypothetical protein
MSNKSRFSHATSIGQAVGAVPASGIVARDVEPCIAKITPLRRANRELSICFPCPLLFGTNLDLLAAHCAGASAGVTVVIQKCLFQDRPEYLPASMPE